MPILFKLMKIAGKIILIMIIVSFKYFGDEDFDINWQIFQKKKNEIEY